MVKSNNTHADVLHMAAAQERLAAVVRGQQVDVMAPNIEWPVDEPRKAGDA